MVVSIDMNERSNAAMKNTTSVRIRVRRFISDRYAYRTRPDFLVEFVAFGIVTATALWPIFPLTTAMASALR